MHKNNEWFRSNRRNAYSSSTFKDEEEGDGEEELFLSPSALAGDDFWCIYLAIAELQLLYLRNK